MPNDPYNNYLSSKIALMILCPTSGCIKVFLLSFITVLASMSATANPLPDFKPNGIGLEWYQHELDLDITHINTTLPGISAQQLEAAKGQLETLNTIKMVSLRLDRQIRPYLNISGSIGKVTDTTDIKFSRLSPLFSDMSVDNKGNIYSVGVTLKRHQGQLITSLEYIHSRIHLDNNSEEIVINTVIPTLGYQTDLGIFSASLAYQGFEAVYSGVVSAPIVGDVPVSVTAENSRNFQLLAKYDTQLRKDLSVSSYIGLNGQKQFYLRLNKRF